MGGFGRYSSSALALMALLGGAGCQEELPPIEGTSSLRVELMAPSETGSQELRLTEGTEELSFRVIAMNTRGETDTTFNASVDVYIHFLGSREIPGRGDRPIARVTVTDGVSAVSEVSIPKVYGPTVLWVEDAESEFATYATGTSPTLWFRDPFLADVSRPRDETALDALQASPLEEKQILVTGSRHGARGRLVVTAIYSQGYTVSDVLCQDADGMPPCTTGDYDHLFVFSFGRATYEGGGEVRLGHSLGGLGGSLGEFNGLTELNFPQTFAGDREERPDRIPEPVLIDKSWLAEPIRLERLEAGLVAVEGGEICPLDSAYERFGQWKLDIGEGCKKGVSVVTRSVVSGFEPTKHIGGRVKRVVGTLRPVNIGSFHVWILYPRDNEDLVIEE